MIELKNKFHCARTHKIIIKIAKRVWIIELNTNFTQKFSCLHAPRSHRLHFVLFSLKTAKLISISRRRSVSIALSYFLWVTACIIYVCGNNDGDEINALLMIMHTLETKRRCCSHHFVVFVHRNQNRHKTITIEHISCNQRDTTITRSKKTEFSDSSWIQKENK